MGVKAVIFDFWGTLVSTGTWSPLKQSQQILRVNTPFSSFVPIFEQAFMTQSFKDQHEAFTKVCEAFDVAPIPIVLEKLIGVWNTNKILAKLFPETMEVLEWLKSNKYKLALISNTDCFGIETVIEKFELTKFFDSIQFSFKTGLLKTDPKAFDVLLKELKVKKNEVVMVGDSIESDMKGAEQAGITGVLVDRRGMREYTNKIKDLHELKTFLEK